MGFEPTRYQGLNLAPLPFGPSGYHLELTLQDLSSVLVDSGLFLLVTGPADILLVPILVLGEILD